MDAANVDWLSTNIVLVVMGAIYLCFFVSGRFFKAGMRHAAVSAPVWVFVPIAVLGEWLVRGAISLQSVAVFLVFALALCLVTWLHIRSEA